MHYFFYENNSTGTLFDYSNNGELDESGTWDFTFTKTEEGDEPEGIKKIFVSGGSMSYPHYSFSNSDGDELDMQDFEFQPDTKYRFIAENLNVSHPFTIGASINGSDIIKFTKITPPDLPVLEEHNFTGVSEDLEVLGNDLLMPPQEEDFEDDYVLSVNGDYFDFEYSKDLLTAFEEHDVNFYYLCDIHSEMNGRLFLSGPEPEGDPIYELNDNQIMDVTGLSWTELETKAPGAAFIQTYGGKFALIEESLEDHQMPDDPHGNSVLKLFPVIQDQDDDWVLELHDFDGFVTTHNRAYFEDDWGLVPVGFLQHGDDDNGSGNGAIELDGSVIDIELLVGPFLVGSEVLTFHNDKVTIFADDFLGITSEFESSYEHEKISEDRFNISVDRFNEENEIIGYDVYQFVETNATGSRTSLRFDGSGEDFNESNYRDEEENAPDSLGVSLGNLMMKMKGMMNMFGSMMPTEPSAEWKDLFLREIKNSAAIFYTKYWNLPVSIDTLNFTSSEELITICR